MELKRQTLFTGTVILLFSNIIVKGLGFFYRIFLVRNLGTEAMGLIEMISPIYSVFLVLAGWGIALGLSTKIAEKSCSDDYESCRQYITAGKRLLKLFGLTATVISFLFLPVIAQLIADKRSMLALICILPAIFIITSASPYRGIFQGIRRVSELGNAQIVEQLVRVIVGVTLTYLFFSQVTEVRIVAISLATLVGELAGMLFIRARWLKYKSIFFPNNLLELESKKNVNKYYRELLHFGTPVTVTRLVISLVVMLQALIVPYALQQSGMNLKEAITAYGAFMSVSLTLLHLPGIFTSALSVSVIPAVAESGSRQTLLELRINKALKATVLFTLPGMLCLFIFAEPLCTMLFHATLGAAPLKIMALGGITLYIQLTLAGVLQGISCVSELLKNNVISGIVFLMNLYFLTKNPHLGLVGTAWAFNIDFAFCALLNYISIKKHISIKIDKLNVFYKPLLACSLTTIAIMLNQTKLLEFAGHPLYILIFMLLTMGIYFLIIFALNGFKFDIKLK